MKLLQLFFETRDALADLIAPPRRSAALVQSLTAEQLRAIARGKDPAYAPEIKTLLPYRDKAAKALIWEMKYRRDPRAFALAAALLREELLGAGEESIGRPLLLPVPMHEARRKERGYNQTELLCETIVSDAWLALDYASHALARVRGGAPQ